MHTAQGSSRQLWPQQIENRLRHDANTLSGSSGGLILDDEFELIALHQAGIEFGNQERINTAIPTACIAKVAQAANDVVGIDPMWSIAATEEPVFGREGLQYFVLNALTGRQRILVIRGVVNSGKTFSAAILRDRLNIADHALIKLSARLLPNDAREFAALLLRAAGASSSSLAELPDPALANTAREAWIRDVLLPDVLGRLKVAASSNTLWLFIDDLDVAPLAHGGAQILLELLLESAIEQAYLRFVLIGGSQYTRNCLLGRRLRGPGPGCATGYRNDHATAHRCTRQALGASSNSDIGWSHYGGRDECRKQSHRRFVA
jgi:hypothetical protein